MKRPVSSRIARACAMFGLDAGARRSPPSWCAVVAAELDAALRPGGVALLCGPSGAGKSATLRTLVRRLRTRGRRVAAAPSLAHTRRAAVELFRGGLSGAMSHLARAGLADAAVMVRPPDRLSDGQRSRLSLAVALARAKPGATLVLDEFGSTLDRPTASSLARAVRRWAGEARVRLVCATAHDDLLEPLAPDLLVEFSLGKPPVVHARRRARRAA
jgi:ABC-type ATPase with predicted acetyltransferase domain